MEEDYEEMTVVELKALAKKRSVKLPYNAIKDQIIEALDINDHRKIAAERKKTPTTMSNETEKKNETPARKADSKWSSNPEPPKGGKEEVNLYQKAPDLRAWLTDDEAKEEGFYVAEKPKSA